MHDIHGMFADEKENEMFFKEIRKGFLKAILLNIIHEKPIHGYDIIRTIAEKSHDRWTPSPGSVYPALEYLESKGYIVSQEVERKKVYTITPKGEEAIEKMKNLRSEMLKELSAFFGNL
jgi:DNA-binding PadR family transcriptional regulator